MSSKVGCLVMNDSEPPLAALNGWVAPFVEVAEDEGDDLIVPVTNVLLAHAAKGDRKQRHVGGARAASSTHGGIAPKPPHKMNVLEAPTSALQSERESILKQLEIFGDRCECSGSRFRPNSTFAVTTVQRAPLSYFRKYQHH